MALWDIFRRFLGTAGPDETADTAAAPTPDRERDFKVLLCPLDGDDGGLVGKALADVLTPSNGLVLQRVDTGLGRVDDSDVLPVDLCRAAARGRKLAEQHEADVVIWGEITDDRQARLRFLPAFEDGDPASGGILPGDVIDLPIPPGVTLDLAAACALAAVPCVTDIDRRRRLERLRALMNSVERLMPGNALSGPARTRASLCYAAMVAEAGFRTGQRALLDRMIEVNRAALARKADIGPAQIAAARARSGDVLTDLGNRDKDAVMLEEAVGHLRAASDIYTLETFPDEYAHLMAQRGRALHRLGTLQGKSAPLREAAQVYFAATKVWTKTTRPERWAELQNAMGGVMATVGELSGNAEVFDRACKVFTLACDVWTREKQPRRWANLQNNLGACRFAQGKRSGDLPTLREALNHFERALEIYKAAGMTRNIHVTQKNIARVERLIAVQETKT